MTGLAEKPANKGGRRHEPTDRERETVEVLAGYGVPEEQIARIIRIAPMTLRKRYREELDRGMAVANSKVAQRLFEIATGSGREAVTAAIFWLKCRAGWSEFAPGPVREPPRGKKAEAQLAAETADIDTGWAGLVN